MKRRKERLVCVLSELAEGGFGVSLFEKRRHAKENAYWRNEVAIEECLHDDLRYVRHREPYAGCERYIDKDAQPGKVPICATCLKSPALHSPESRPSQEVFEVWRAMHDRAQAEIAERYRLTWQPFEGIKNRRLGEVAVRANGELAYRIDCLRIQRGVHR